MAEQTILTALDDDGVASVALNKPKLHNAFDDALIEDMLHVLDRLEQDPAVRCVVISGRGASFSAGADINWMRRMAEYNKKQNQADALRLAELMHKLNSLNKPTIARVHGAAFGGGVGLVACCDLAVASDKASFCLSEVKLGLIPAVISPYLIRAIGERHARRYCISAERFDAREAMRIGLLHRVVDADALDERIAKLALSLCANGPQAMAAAKKLVREVADAPLDQALINETASRIAEIRISDEGQEGLEAFLSKRKPDWAESD